MECKQVRDQWGCWALLLNRTCSREETLETIVPDASPDIARILDTSGVCRLTRRELTEGGVLLSGTIQTVTLYVPEGEQGVCRLESTLSFQHLHECQKPEGETGLLAKAWVSSAETRTVNPRKVLVRVDLSEQVRLYGQRTFSVCTGLEAEPEQGLQQRLDRCRTALTADLTEKPFTLQDTFPLNPGRRENCRLLRVLPGLQCSEARRMGAKLVLKGTLTLSALMGSADGQLFPLESELPFSQMLDAPETEGEWDVQVELQLTDFVLGELSADGRSLPVTAQILASAVYGETISFCALTDLFSTRYPVEFRQEELVLHQRSNQSQRLTLREQVQTPHRVQAVCSCQTFLGQVVASQEGEQLRLLLSGVVSVVYQGEDGVYDCLQHPFRLEATLQQPGEDVCLCSCELEQMEALLSASGLELRGSVNLGMDTIHQQGLSVVTAAEIDLDSPVVQAGQPSVVLCRPGRGERVWDLAKRYRSTCQQICDANGMEEDQVCGSGMLLVPCRR